jgi:hypothetical protein
LIPFPQPFACPRPGVLPVRTDGRSLVRNLPCLAAALIFLGAVGGRLGAESNVSVPTTAGSGVTLRIATPVSTLPRFGFLPVRIQVDNQADRAGTWQIRFQSGEPDTAAGTTASRLVLTAAAHERKDIWYFVPLSEVAPAFTLGAPPATAATGALRGRTQTAAAVESLSTTAGVETRARSKLVVAVPAAGSAGRWQWTSRLEPGNRPGENIGIATALQSISFNEAPLTGRDLPLGFDVVDRVDPITHWTERHFLYKESLPDPTGEAAPKSSAWSTLSSSVTAEATARQALADSGLLLALPGVTEAVTVSALTSGRTGGPVAWLTTFIQSGSSRVLPVQTGLAVPPGAVINLHASTQPGEVVRTVTFVEPDALVALEDKSAADAAVGPAVAAASARAILMRYGYLRPQPGVEISPVPPAGTNFTMPAPHAGATMWFESGPKELLPAPVFGTLPPNTAAYVLPGATPGETLRCFAVGPPAKFSTPSDAAAGASGGSPAVLAMQVTGPGVLGAADVAFSGLIAGTPSLAPPLAVSRHLAAMLRQTLYNASMRGAMNLNPVDTLSAAPDWRMWSPFHGVLITQAEYEALDAAQRDALQSWVMQGGYLYLEPTVEGPLTGVPLRVTRLGAGSITLLPWTLDDYLAPPVYDPPTMNYVKVAEPSAFLPLLQLHSLALTLPAGDAMRPAPLAASTPRYGTAGATMSRWAVALLAGFALLAGPLNLVRFAPSGRRHRMFLTTPLFAGACLAALAGVAVWGDGVGGAGDRHAVVVMVSGESRAVVYQDQSSTTGLLARRGFALESGTLLTNLAVEAYDATGRATAFERDNGTAGGDWFRHHWGTAQHLRQVSAMRGGVAVRTTGAVPTVESSLPAALRDFYYVDARNQPWFVAEVGPGKAVPLARATVAQWPPLNPTGSKYLETVFTAAARVEPGRWLARGASSALAPIATLEGITWHDEVVFTGVAGDRLPDDSAETGVAE